MIVIIDGVVDSYGATLYKTELCRSFADTGQSTHHFHTVLTCIDDGDVDAASTTAFKCTGYCRYGLKCRFAHGSTDLRPGTYLHPFNLSSSSIM
jgi:hypothetical protein